MIYLEEKIKYKMINKEEIKLNSKVYAKTVNCINEQWIIARVVEIRNCNTFFTKKPYKMYCVQTYSNHFIWVNEDDIYLRKD